MRLVTVPLGARSYPILIGPKLLPQLGAQCQLRGLARRCAIITDTRVGPRYARLATRSLANSGFDPIVVTVPAGESSKCWKVVARCHDQLAAHRLERKSFIVALGGGVVGDLAGFVAATYLRGVDFVQVPTTLLAQVDSSVGGKVGINLKSGKNLVGAFYQPRLVLCDLDTLQSLPPREFHAGLAEVIKYGIICDAELFRRLEREMPKLLRLDRSTLAAVVERCCQIKADVVGRDENESGPRAILNFGHTVGHGLEAISAYHRYLHGEAISIGQIAAAHLSARLTGLRPDDVQRVRRLFNAAQLPTTVRLTAAQQSRLFQAMKLDKKVSNGELKFVLAERIGKVRWGHPVSEGLVREALSAVAKSKPPS